MLESCLIRHLCSRQQFWEELAGATGSLSEGLSPESMGSLGGWGGPETLAWVHPLEFATKISQVSRCRSGSVYVQIVVHGFPACLIFDRFCMLENEGRCSRLSAILS